MQHRENFGGIWFSLYERYGIKIRFKDESRFMKLIGFILFFNRGFMTDYITTIGRTIYFPTRKEIDQDHPPWETLAHEGIHVMDYVRNPARFVARYLFPQWLPLLAIGAIGAIWWPGAWLCLFALLALLPFPSPGRTALERRGYMMTMVCDALQFGPEIVRSEPYQDWMIGTYTGPAYYYMDTNHERVSKFVREDSERAIGIASGTIHDPDYSWVPELLATFGDVKAG